HAPLRAVRITPSGWGACAALGPFDANAKAIEAIKIGREIRSMITPMRQVGLNWRWGGTSQNSLIPPPRALHKGKGGRSPGSKADFVLLFSALTLAEWMRCRFFSSP